MLLYRGMFAVFIVECSNQWLMGPERISGAYAGQVRMADALGVESGSLVHGTWGLLEANLFVPGLGTPNVIL